MTESQETLNYRRIEKAIRYLQTNFQQQPSLEELAAIVHVSPAHFQRLFTDWAGTSPKKFLQYISIEHAKRLLKNQQATLFDTTFDTGLSSTSRLHDLFVRLEGMSPAEYKNGGRNLSIRYCFAESPFGNVIVASTSKGICHLAFEENEPIALQHLKNQFPEATIQSGDDVNQQNALLIFQKDWSQLPEIKLHLKGTEFQLKVWESLLSIPMGKLTTYGSVAKQIELPQASRAVGTAIGRNPVAYLIPCHRVIQSTGIITGYRWGSTRKAAMIGWECAR